MAEIMTVLGPIAPESLGFTSMHEHILLDSSGVYPRRHERAVSTEVRAAYQAGLPADLKDAWSGTVSLATSGLLRGNLVLVRDNLVIDDEDLMMAEVTDFKETGGAAMLDVSGIGLRTNVAGVQRIAQRSGVHVVVSTGFYTEDSWPEQYHGFSIERFHRHMVKEIEEGIDDTSIKAGHIKLAVTDLSLAQERVLRAGARAAIDTGAAVTVHPGFGIGSDGRRIATILIAEGLAPERIVIAHADGFLVERDLRTLILNPESWGLRLDYHRALLDQGVNISFDCFGHLWNYEMLDEIIEHDWQRVAGVVALVKAGYSSQIVLGTDTFVKMLTRRYGGEGYSRLTRYVVPLLRRLQVAEYEIRQMTVEAPARVLAK